MLKRAITITILATLFFTSIGASAQSNCGTKLYCLIPAALHTTSATFNFFNHAFGTQIGQLPLATPASGFVYSFDKSGVYTASSESFGPLLAERSETIGRHKLYLAFTYQRFAFDDIDGNNIKTIPILFYIPNAQNAQFVTITQNRVDTKIDQYVAFATFGLASRFDVSVAVPFERVSMGVRSRGTEYSTTSSATASFTEFLAGSASGIGDVVLSAKGTLIKRERFGVALGAELRFPSGDEQNFLGSGAYGVKPYLVLSRRGRVAPHLNVGYQWNANSLLATNENGNQRLPGYFGYAAGADLGLTKRLTVVADLLGEHFFDAPQISKPRNISALVNNQQVSFSSVVRLNSDSYDANNLSVGLKVNPVGHLLLSANVLVKLNEGGVRARLIPLVGLSYSF
jgi:hypothetical protein